MQTRVISFFALRNSLRLKVSLGVLFPLLLVLSTFTILEYQQLRRAMLSQLSLIASQSGQVIEENLRQQMLVNDFASIQRILDSIDESQGFRSIFLLNPQAKVIFSPFGQDVGLQLDKSQPSCQICHSLPASERMQSVVVTSVEGVDVFRSMKPIENSPACSQCHDPEQRIIGLLLIDIGTGPVEASLTRDLRRNLLWWGAAILVVLVVVNLGLNFFVLHPLEGFASAFNDMGVGQSPPCLPEGQSDEIGRLAKGFNWMAQQVESRQLENTALSARLRTQNMQRGELLKRLITVQEDERKRIARELHDELGQSLSALSLHTEGILRLLDVDPSRAREQTDKVKHLAVEASEQMHDLILDLRPSVLDDLGLAAALRSYADHLFSATSTSYILDASHLVERLPQAVETALYRSFQEALNNIARHAGATLVSISLTKDERGFTGEIRDNGQGFDPAIIQVGDDDPRGLGILGMQERITICGGRLEIHSESGQGTLISIHIPSEALIYE
jgi:signal transduction histidine kinase